MVLPVARYCSSSCPTVVFCLAKGSSDDRDKWFTIVVDRNYAALQSGVTGEGNGGADFRGLFERRPAKRLTMRLKLSVWV